MRKVITLFDVQGAERVRAQMGMMESGMGSYRSNLERTSRSAGILDGQLRALSTTARYMFSGVAIYGTLEMIKTLGQFQSKLGEISSIATTTGNTPITGGLLDQLGTKIIDVSNRTAQPVADLQEGLLALYSTIGDVPPNRAAEMMNTIAEVANSSQSNIVDTTNALLGMANAFGAGAGSVRKFGDEFQVVIQKSAGMPGSIYAQKLGVLSSSASLAGFTPEQMGALAIGATRSGGSAATNMQYLAQFTQSLMHPQTKKNEAEMARLGLGSANRKRLGAWGTLQAFMQRIDQAGGVGLTRAQIASSGAGIENGLLGDDASLGSIGGLGGGADIIDKAFGRLQSKRMAAILYKVSNQAQVAGTENETLTEYLKMVQGSAGATAAANRRKMDQSGILQASNSLHNMGISFGTSISAALQPIAHVITGLSSSFNNQGAWEHRAELFGGGVAGVGAYKFLRARGLAPRVGVVGAGLDAFTETGRGNTPLKPLYVAVVYSLAGGLGTPRIGGPGGLYGPGSPYGPKTAENAGYTVAAKTEAAAAGRLSRYAKYLKLAPWAVAAAAPEVAFAAGGLALDYNLWRNNIRADDMRDASISNHTLYKYLTTAKTGGHNAYFMGKTIGFGAHHIPLSAKEQQVIDAVKAGNLAPNAAERILRSIATKGQLENANVKGIVGKATVDVNVVQGGKVTQTKKVTMDLFPAFTTSPPTQRAKPKTQRG